MSFFCPEEIKFKFTWNILKLARDIKIVMCFQIRFYGSGYNRKILNTKGSLICLKLSFSPWL